MTDKQFSYYFNEHKKQLEIYRGNLLHEIISDINSKSQAKEFFEMEYNNG